MKAGGVALALIALMVATPATAQDVTVTATQLPTFRGTPVGQQIQSLIYRGGLQLSSVDDRFGGLSGLGFLDVEGRMVAVSDRGQFLSGQLIHDEAGAPLSLVGVRMSAIQNSRGADLPRAYARDAEGLAVVHRDGEPYAVRVSFENLTRVADFQLENGVPGGPAREVSIPSWLSDTRTNESLESVCIAPPASPIAGSTLLITEGVWAGDDGRAAWLLGNRDRGALTYRPGPGLSPTDCAFLPNGDLLVLERGVSILAFGARLARVPADEVYPGAEMQGHSLFQTVGGDLDNMEGVAVRHTPGGELRVVLLSDDNFNDWQRTVLLEFSIAE